MAKEVTFAGTLDAVQRQATEWIAAHPDVVVIDAGSPFAVGDQLDLIHTGDWTRTIRFEEWPPSGSLFAEMAQAIFGDQYVAPLANLLNVEKKTVMNMAAGKSRIPPGIWGEIAVLLHDLGKLRLDALRDAAAKASLGALARVYKVRNIAISVEPSADGRWPKLKISNKPYNQPSFWRYVREDERQLPGDTTSAVLEFDGELGQPFLVSNPGRIIYPKNMNRMQARDDGTITIDPTRTTNAAGTFAVDSSSPVSADGRQIRVTSGPRPGLRRSDR